jgi:serine/threonine-protein kinase RsbW
VTAREIEIAIDSRLENVSLVGLAVHRIGEAAGLPSAESHHLELCTVEAVSNAIRHAYGGEQGHTVSVRLRLEPDRIEVRVRDEGRPLPEERRTPRRPDYDPGNLESIPEGGWGLFLIHQMMDRVEYATDGGANVLVMTKRIPEPSRVGGPAGEP